MASTTIVKVTVEALSKFGFKANGKYVNYSKQFNEADKAKVIPGAELEAELYIADSGKEYLNKVLSTSFTHAPVEAAAPVIDMARAKRFTPSFKKAAAPDNSMSKEEWKMKDERISRQGLLQSAFIALAPVVSLDRLFVEASKLADKGLEYVNKSATTSA